MSDAPTDDPDFLDLRYGVYVNDAAVAGFVSSDYAEQFVDMLCSTAEKGTLIELTDDCVVVGGFDREGREITFPAK